MQALKLPWKDIHGTMGTSPLTQDTLTFPMYHEARGSLLGEGGKAYPGRPLGPEKGETFPQG